MTVTTPPRPGEPDGAEATSAPTSPIGEACPLCGAPLRPEQEWCLSCGAAARTRLAASPGWRAPIVALVVVLVLSLGILAGSLVKLAGGSPTPVTQTTTVTTAASAATATTATQSTTPTTPPVDTSTAARTPTATGAAPTSGAVRKALEHSGVNPSKIKQSVAERLRKLGLGLHTKK